MEGQMGQEESEMHNYSRFPEQTRTHSSTTLFQGEWETGDGSSEADRDEYFKKVSSCWLQFSHVTDQRNCFISFYLFPSLPSLPISTHLLPSLPISSHLLPSPSISSHLFPSLPISSHLLPSLPISSHLFPSSSFRKHWDQPPGWMQGKPPPAPLDLSCPWTSFSWKVKYIEETTRKSSLLTPSTYTHPPSTSLNTHTHPPSTH